MAKRIVGSNRWIVEELREIQARRFWELDRHDAALAKLNNEAREVRLKCPHVTKHEYFDEAGYHICCAICGWLIEYDKDLLPAPPRARSR